MRKTLTLLAASTALTAVIGMPAWSAVSARSDASPPPFAAMADSAAQPQPLVVASDDADENDGSGRQTGDDGDDDDESDRDDDGDDDDDDCDENDVDEDDDCHGGTQNPAPAGTVAPPQNGLFGNGTPPQVKVN